MIKVRKLEKKFLLLLIYMKLMISKFDQKLTDHLC